MANSNYTIIIHEFDEWKLAGICLSFEFYILSYCNKFPAASETVTIHCKNFLNEKLFVINIFSFNDPEMFIMGHLFLVINKANKQPNEGIKIKASFH